MRACPCQVIKMLVCNPTRLHPFRITANISLSGNKVAPFLDVQQEPLKRNRIGPCINESPNPDHRCNIIVIARPIMELPRMLNSGIR